jgi:hypothetical protein
MEAEQEAECQARKLIDQFEEENPGVKTYVLEQVASRAYVDLAPQI